MNEPPARAGWWWSPELQVVSLRPPVRRPDAPGVLLLDRDGTLIVERHYLGDPAGVELVPEAVEACRRARARGWAIGLVSNQGGIALGRFGWDDLAAVQAALDARLATHDLALDVVLACPFHPDAAPANVTIPKGRKPKPGMILLAIEWLDSAAERGVLMVGDKASDVAAARAAGCAGLRVDTRTATAPADDPTEEWRAVWWRIDRGREPERPT